MHGGCDVTAGTKWVANHWLEVFFTISASRQSESRRSFLLCAASIVQEGTHSTEAEPVQSGPHLLLKAGAACVSAVAYTVCPRRTVPILKKQWFLHRCRRPSSAQHATMANGRPLRMRCGLATIQHEGCCSNERPCCYRIAVHNPAVRFHTRRQFRWSF